jgi:hypothetical protein
LQSGPTRDEVTARCRRLGSDIFARRLLGARFYGVRRDGSDLGIARRRTLDLANAPVNGTSPPGERLYLRSSSSICRNSLDSDEFSDESRFVKMLDFAPSIRLSWRPTLPWRNWRDLWVGQLAGGIDFAAVSQVCWQQGRCV